MVNGTTTHQMILLSAPPGPAVLWRMLIARSMLHAENQRQLLVFITLTMAPQALLAHLPHNQHLQQVEAWHLAPHNQEFSLCREEAHLAFYRFSLIRLALLFLIKIPQSQAYNQLGDRNKIFLRL